MNTLKSRNLYEGTKYIELCEYVNDFTKELDKHNSFVCVHGGECYILKNKIEDEDCGGYAFRVPGATRGFILVDANNVITEIIFYDNTCFGYGLGCFVGKVQEVKAVANKYIGWRIEFA